jgi:hypothetical protein
MVFWRRRRSEPEPKPEPAGSREDDVPPWVDWEERRGGEDIFMDIEEAAERTRPSSPEGRSSGEGAE